jgi:hypothetical protein
MAADELSTDQALVDGERDAAHVRTEQDLVKILDTEPFWANLRGIAYDLTSGKAKAA